MAYVDGFDYDVFVSYARVDDRAASWVTRFEARLQLYLDELLGRSNAARIFVDRRELDENQKFDPVIESAARQSAVLLTVTSRGLLESEYCKKEVACFCDAAKNGVGMTIGRDHHGRVFVALRFDIPYTDWFAGLDGIGSFPFFRAGAKDGIPVDPGSTDKDVEDQFRNLAAKIANTLEIMNGTVGRLPSTAPRVSQGPLTVFLAPATGDLIFDRNDVREKLGASETILKFTDPPNASLASSIDALRNSDLAILLVDARPSADTLRLLEAARNHSSRWILAVHPEVNLSGPGADPYLSLLASLRDKDGDRRYKWLHRPNDTAGCIDVNAVCDAAVSALEDLERQRASKQLMLDGHRDDRDLLKKIERYVNEKRKVATVRAQTDGQSQVDAYSGYEKVFNECRGALLVYGDIERTWVVDRFKEVKKAYRLFPDPEKHLGVVYGPPPDAKTRFGGTIKIGQTLLLLHEIDYTEMFEAEIDSFLENAGLWTRV